VIWDSEKAQTDRLYWLGKNRDFVTKFSEMVDKNRQIGRFNRDKIVDFSAIFITWVSCTTTFPLLFFDILYNRSSLHSTFVVPLA
jgi:hypothetical protein